MSTLTVTLKRVSETHHSFSVIRKSEDIETVELETKTFLEHDFIHFALESNAHLKESFFGMLAKGKSYGDVIEPIEELNSEIAATERIVGALTGVIKGNASPKECISGVENLFSAYGKPVPEWLTEELIDKVALTYQKLIGEWNSTPFGDTMELQFNA